MAGSVPLVSEETILGKHVGEETRINLQDNFLFGVRKYCRRTERILRDWTRKLCHTHRIKPLYCGFLEHPHPMRYIFVHGRPFPLEKPISDIFVALFLHRLSGLLSSDVLHYLDAVKITISSTQVLVLPYHSKSLTYHIYHMKCTYYSTCSLLLYSRLPSHCYPLGHGNECRHF